MHMYHSLVPDMVASVAVALPIAITFQKRAVSGKQG